VPVQAFRPVTAHGADGSVAGLLLWYPSLDAGGRWLECEVDALREGLAAAPTAPIVGFFPDDTPSLDVPRLISAAMDALADETVVAPLVPVNDAVKRVEGRRIVSTVDRSGLSRVRGPTFARTDAVLRVLGAARGGTIRPLVAVAAADQIGRLDAEAATG